MSQSHCHICAPLALHEYEVALHENEVAPQPHMMPILETIYYAYLIKIISKKFLVFKYLS